MSKRCFFFFALLISSAAAVCQSSRPLAPETVDISNGTIHLKGYLWKPAGPGPFPAVLFNHGRSNGPQQHTRDLTITAAARMLGPVFVKHGYLFLYLFRRGEGLSADQGSFIGDLLDREATAHGEDARTHLQFVLLTTEHLEDATSALSFLKSLPAVDPLLAICSHADGDRPELQDARLVLSQK